MNPKYKTGKYDCENPDCENKVQVYGCRYCPDCYPEWSRKDDEEWKRKKKCLPPSVIG